MEYKKEEMNGVFTKHHVTINGFTGVFHQFTGVDINEDFHDHPFSFTTHILKGSYIERVYTKIYFNGTSFYSYQDRLREAGETHHVRTDHIHKIIALPEGECWTIIIPEKWEKKSGFWRFNEEGIFYRDWDQEEFKQVH